MLLFKTMANFTKITLHQILKLLSYTFNTYYLIFAIYILVLRTTVKNTVKVENHKFY